MHPELEDRLKSTPGEWVPLEEFGPLPRCLEWQLSRYYWEHQGPTAFFGGEVPYAVINDGRLSADAAKLLIELLKGSNTNSVRVLEIGGGSGLFAKLFLDEVRNLAPEVYQSITYNWSDASPTMVERAEREGLFSGHPGKVKCRVVAIPDMSALHSERDAGFDLIVVNYLLDNLPATLLRLSPYGMEELEVRTTLRGDLDRSRLGGITAFEWRERIRTKTHLRELVDLYPWFSLECRYRKVERDSLPFAALIPQPTDGSTVLWSHHPIAWEWLRSAVGFLRPRGGILINDYGHFPSKRTHTSAAFQHFGGSLANGINFDELASFPKIAEDWKVTAPEQDSRQLYSRWISPQAEEFSAGVFRILFAGARRDQVLDLVTRAEDSVEQGLNEEARWLFWQAHANAPRCWYVLERWAAFCISRLKDPQSGLELAQIGLELHPLSPALWNIKGDALYELKQFSQAEECYLQAIAINPRETLGRLNMAYVLFETGRHARALLVLAEALAFDKKSDHREAILEKQRQVLQRISRENQEAVIQQANRFRNLGAP